MRSFIVSLLIGAFLITGSILYTKNMERISSEMIECNDIIYSLISEGNYDEAVTLVDSLKNYMDRKSVMLAAIDNHEEIDKIENSLAQLEQYILQKSQADSLALSKALDVHLQHLPKNYRLKLENIL